VASGTRANSRPERVGTVREVLVLESSFAESLFIEGVVVKIGLSGFLLPSHPFPLTRKVFRDTLRRTNWKLCDPSWTFYSHFYTGEVRETPRVALSTTQVMTWLLAVVVVCLYCEIRWTAGMRALRNRLNARKIPIEPAVFDSAGLEGLPAPV